MQHKATILGPMPMQIKVKVQQLPKICGEAFYTRNPIVTYGGPLIKISKLLKSLSYDNNLIGYVGRDEVGEKTIEIIKKELPSAIVQRLSNDKTPISFLMHDNRSFSYLLTENHDLSLWLLRIREAQLKKIGIIYLDPSIPTPQQLLIIKENPKSVFIVKKPMDNDLRIFKNNTNLVVLLSEFDAFHIASQTSSNVFKPENLLCSSLMKRHHCVLETKDDLNIWDASSKTIKSVDLRNIRRHKNSVSEAFVAGVMAGILSDQSSHTSFLWGLATTVKDFRQEKIDRTSVASLAVDFKWTVRSINQY
jgi:hypothetical protein